MTNAASQVRDLPRAEPVTDALQAEACITDPSNAPAETAEPALTPASPADVSVSTKIDAVTADAGEFLSYSYVFRDSSDQRKEFFAELASPLNYKEQESARNKVHGLLVGMLTYALDIQKDGREPINDLIEYYQIPDSEFHSLVEEVCLYQISLGKEYTPLFESFSLPFTIPDLRMVYETVKLPSSSNLARRGTRHDPSPSITLGHVAECGRKFEHFLGKLIGSGLFDGKCGAAAEDYQSLKTVYDWVHMELTGALDYAVRHLNCEPARQIIYFYQVDRGIVDALVDTVCRDFAGSREEGIAALKREFLINGAQSSGAEPAAGQTASFIPSDYVKDVAARFKELQSDYESMSKGDGFCIAAKEDYQEEPHIAGMMHGLLVAAMQWTAEYGNFAAAQEIIEFYEVDPKIVQSLLDVVVTHPLNENRNVSWLEVSVKATLELKNDVDHSLVEAVLPPEPVVETSAPVFTPTDAQRDVPQCFSLLQYHSQTLHLQSASFKGRLIHDKNEYKRSEKVADTVHTYLVGALQRVVRNFGCSVAQSIVSFYEIDSAIVTQLALLVHDHPCNAEDGNLYLLAKTFLLNSEAPEQRSQPAAAEVQAFTPSAKLQKVSSCYFIMVRDAAKLGMNNSDYSGCCGVDAAEYNSALVMGEEAAEKVHTYLVGALHLAATSNIHLVANRIISYYKMDDLVVASLAQMVYEYQDKKASVNPSYLSRYHVDSIVDLSAAPAEQKFVPQGILTDPIGCMARSRETLFRKIPDDAYFSGWVRGITKEEYQRSDLHAGPALTVHSYLLGALQDALIINKAYYAEKIIAFYQIDAAVVSALIGVLNTESRNARRDYSVLNGITSASKPAQPAAKPAPAGVETIPECKKIFQKFYKNGTANFEERLLQYAQLDHYKAGKLFDVKWVERMLRGSLAQAVIDNNYQPARTIVSAYQLEDEEVLLSVGEEVYLYAISCGFTLSDDLLSIVNLPEGVPSPERCLKAAEKGFAELLLCWAPDAAYAFAAKHGISDAQQKLIIGNECANAILNLEVGLAQTLISETQISRAAVPEACSRETFLAALPKKFGENPPVGSGDGEALFEIAGFLEVEQQEVQQVISDVFKARVDSGNFTAAVEIIGEYQIEPQFIRQCLLAALPKHITAAGFEKMLQLLSDSNLADEIASDPSYQKGAADLIARKLGSANWHVGLQQLFDLGLISPDVRGADKVLDAAYDRLVELFCQNTDNALDVVLLISSFGLSRPEITGRTIKRVCRFLEQGQLEFARNVVGAHKITRHTPGFEKVGESLKGIISQSLKRLDLVEASSICLEFGANRQSFTGICLEAAAAQMRKGDLTALHGFALWLDLEPGELISQINGSDAREGFLQHLRRGWSDAVEQLAEASDLAAEDLYLQVSKENLIECISSDIRFARWEALEKTCQVFENALAAFDISADQIKELAEEQLQEVLAMGDPSHAAEIIRYFDIDQENLTKQALQAALRAYRMADTTRVDAIFKIDPFIEDALQEPELAQSVMSAFRELLASGYRGPQVLHFQQMFDMSRDDLLACTEEIRIGISNELSSGNPELTLKLVDELNLGLSYVVQGILTLPQSSIVKQENALKRLCHKLERRNIDLKKLAGKDGARRVETELTLRAGNRERRAASFLVDFFRLDRNAVPRAAVRAGCAFLQKGDNASAYECLNQYWGDTIVPLDQILPDDGKWRELCKLPQDVTTVANLLSHVRALVGNTPAVMQATSRQDIKPYVSKDEARELRRQVAEAVLKDPDSVHSAVPIKNHRQKTDHTCGPASTRMALQAVSGILYDEQETKRWLGTNADVGTPLNHFSRLNRVLKGVEIFVSADGTLDQLRKLLDQGYTIIVNYHIGIDPHYGVVRSISDKAILLSDPTSGPDTGILLDQFDWNGGYDETRVKGGFVAMRLRAGAKREDLPE